MSQLQNLGNHTRVVPLFHLFAFPVSIINFVWAAVRAVRQPSADVIMAAVMAAAIAVAFFYARVFALRVQDRVIRLEMRLRLRELLVPELARRIPEFTPAQLIALRFAGDAELPALARRVLDERLDDRKAIKRLIQDWQADHLRA